MGQRIEVSRTCAVADTKTFLSGGLEAGIITLTFGAQSVKPLETVSRPVNGKMVIGGKSFASGTAPVFLPIVSFCMITRTGPGFGLSEGTAKLLA